MKHKASDHETQASAFADSVGAYLRHSPFPFLGICFRPSLGPPSSAVDDKTHNGLPVLSLDRLLDAVLRSLCIVVCLRGSLLFVLGNTAELCSQRGGGPSGSVIVTPGPGPEECQHLRWATGGLRSSPVRTCWKALRAGLSRPSSVRCRWAVSVLSGRDPVAQDWVPYQVVPPGLVESFACRALKTI